MAVYRIAKVKVVPRMLGRGDEDEWKLTGQFQRAEAGDAFEDVGLPIEWTFKGRADDDLLRSDLANAIVSHARLLEKPFGEVLAFGEGRLSKFVKEFTVKV